MILFAQATPSDIPPAVVQCRDDAFQRIAKGSGDPGAPYMIVTAAGRRYRILGQDFIDPRDWRKGERLLICPEPDDPTIAVTFAHVRDVPRGEDLLTNDLDAPRRASSAKEATREP